MYWLSLLADPPPQLKPRCVSAVLWVLLVAVVVIPLFVVNITPFVLLVAAVILLPHPWYLFVLHCASLVYDFYLSSLLTCLVRSVSGCGVRPGPLCPVLAVLRIFCSNVWAFSRNPSYPTRASFPNINDSRELRGCTCLVPVCGWSE